VLSPRVILGTTALIRAFYCMFMADVTVHVYCTGDMTESCVTSNTTGERYQLRIYCLLYNFVFALMRLRDSVVHRNGLFVYVLLALRS